MSPDHDNNSAATAHPRPDLHRGLEEGHNRFSLDGPWQFAFDPADDGEARGLPEGQSECFDRTIRVPFCWESHLAWGTEAVAGNENWHSLQAYVDPAGVTRDNYNTAPRQKVGWYRREVHCPPVPAGQRMWLHIGAADWEVAVWVNGRPAARGESGYLPFSCDITEAAGTNETAVVVIRVADDPDDTARPLGKQHRWYTPVSGIWQSVWLELRPTDHIRSLALRPRLAPDSVECRASLAGAAEGDIRWTVTDDTGAVCAEMQTAAHMAVSIPLGENTVRWSPDTPHLYHVTAVLIDARGNPVDTVHSYFGLREVGTAALYPGGPSYITLNGEPIYLRGALDQSYNPQGLYTFADDAAIQRELELARAAGFNFLRLHIKLEDPRFLYWADRLGMLLMCDIPNFGYDAWSDKALERWETTLRGAVERDFNHPAIIAWCLFNESWGLGQGEFKNLPDRQVQVEKYYHLAKELDSTRLIEDNSPCTYDHVVSDINSWHFYINDYERAHEHVAAVVSRTFPGSDFNYVPGKTQSAAPLLNSEYGGISARMGDMDVSWCFKFLTDLLRGHEKICGYVYTELQDIEWEYNGIFNYDRTYKEFGYNVRSLQGPVYLGCAGSPARTVPPGSTVTLPLFINRAGFAEKLPPVTWSVRFVDSLGVESIVGEGACNVPQSTSPSAVVPFEITLKLPDRSGLARVELALGDLAANFAVFELWEHSLPPVEALPDGSLILRRRAGDFEVSTAWHEAEIDRGRAGDEVHLLGGVEAGNIDFLFSLPEDFSPGDWQGLTVLLEASSKRLGAPQSDGRPWRSDLAVSLNGVPVGAVTLENQFADSRGALSHMHGLHGRHGQLVCLEADACCLGEALEHDGKALLLRLDVPRCALNHRGLTVYTARAGRYPCDVTLIFHPR